jgi:hypothetical protein
MRKIQSSSRLEADLAQFTSEQKKEIYKNLFAIQLTEGCSSSCSDCGLGALAGVRDYIKPEVLTRIFLDQPRNRYTPNPLLYFASDPFDYDFEGRDYPSIHKEYLEATGKNPGVITSIPRGQEEKIFNILIGEASYPKILRVIDEISISHNNTERLAKFFNDSYVKGGEHILNIQSLSSLQAIDDIEGVDFSEFLGALNKEGFLQVRNYITETSRLRIGRKNIGNLENKRISDYKGTIITPAGVYNLQPTYVTDQNPIGQKITKITKGNFQVLPLEKINTYLTKDKPNL